MAEMVDARDLKSLVPKGRTGSIPVARTKSPNSISYSLVSARRIADDGERQYRQSRGSLSAAQFKSWKA